MFRFETSFKLSPKSKEDLNEHEEKRPAFVEIFCSDGSYNVPIGENIQLDQDSVLLIVPFALFGTIQFDIYIKQSSQFYLPKQKITLLGITNSIPLNLPLPTILNYDFTFQMGHTNFSFMRKKEESPMVFKLSILTLF